MTNNKKYMALAKKAVKNGNWLIRRDNNGISHNGFKWAEQGEWTEAPDWHGRP